MIVLSQPMQETNQRVIEVISAKWGNQSNTCIIVETSNCGAICIDATDPTFSIISSQLSIQSNPTVNPYPSQITEQYILSLMPSAERLLYASIVPNANYSGTFNPYNSSSNPFAFIGNLKRIVGSNVTPSWFNSLANDAWRCGIRWP